MIDLSDLQSNRPLKDLSTLGIGGAARYFIEVYDVAAMQAALLLCQKHSLPFVILGKGSNVLFDDRGFEGVVIANRIAFLDKTDQGIWHAGAGYSFSLLGSQTARQGWSGLEFASGIPGSVGGAVYMNAGANGSDVSRSLMAVDFITAEGELVHFKRENLSFGYRFSSFQKKRGAIVSASFQLDRSELARQKQLEIIEYRKKTQPYDAKSAGCIFRNPSCAHAGALIEQSGLKGRKCGGAEVSLLHANFLINSQGASSADFLALIALVKEEVKKKTGYELEDEVRYIPPYPVF